MILVIKHIDIEGPGSMEDYFLNTPLRLKEIDLSRGDALPDDLKDIEAVVSLGGPMNVYQEDKYPFLKSEDLFLRKALKKEIPILGICLGSQMLARASAAKVRKAENKEVGWYRVNLTKEGKQDPLFRALPENLEVFQWHEDTFALPKSGTLLAESDTCMNQAFKVGKNAYGLQFHIEVTPQMIEAWINKYKHNGQRLEAKDMLTLAHKKQGKFRKQADYIYSNFAGLL
ncbi:MAG: type 1 glutamine amidotransferase [Candidatus Omnitrophota bacterium]